MHTNVRVVSSLRGNVILYNLLLEAERARDQIPSLHSGLVSYLAAAGD